ncbi:hypothetical protein C8Q74DRAFT_1299192, partial [Fomes fomentarius]
MLNRLRRSSTVWPEYLLWHRAQNSDYSSRLANRTRNRDIKNQNQISSEDI